ncbi:MAG: DUF1800 domain-containing protein [Hyphomicrobium sp.]
MASSREAMREKPEDEASRAAMAKQFTGRQQEMKALRLQDSNEKIIAAIYSPTPFFERLVDFWFNHFTVSARNARTQVLVGPFEVEAIRPHVLGRFEDMLLTVVRHPAMIVYLDQSNSLGPNSIRGRATGKGLNENLAREILELHTLGVDGGYSQADVTEFARVLTGWTVDNSEGTFRFLPQRAEPGTKTLLGRSFGGPNGRFEDGISALKMLAAHPRTGRHVARKLCRHFLSDAPTAGEVDAVAEVFRSSGGDLLSVYRRLLELVDLRRHPMTLVKRPYDFVVSALRLTGLTANELLPKTAIKKGRRAQPPAFRFLALMKQPLWSAPGPDGWSEDAATWIDPVGLARRFQFISRLLPQFAGITPAELMRRALGSAVSETTEKTVLNASSREEALSLVLASPEFQRR